MEKRGWVIGVFAFFAISILLLGMVSAVWPLSSSDDSEAQKNIAEMESKLAQKKCTKQDIATRVFCVWLGGLAGIRDFNLAGEVLKVLFLALIVIIVYSSFSYVGFPSSSLLKMLFSVIFGVLFTFLITTQELVTSLLGYSAGGITFVVFFPILVLGIFTFVMASKMEAVGIFIQKIMWVIFSVFLFFRSVTYWVLTTTDCRARDALGLLGSYDFKSSLIGKIPIVGGVLQKIFSPLQTVKDIAGGVIGGVGGALGIDSLQGSCEGFPRFMYSWFVKPFYDSKTLEVMEKTVKGNGVFDTSILVLLIIVSIAVFVIMVLGNKRMVEWIGKEKMYADVKAKENEMDYSSAYDKIRAERLRRAGKPGG